jgi:hypothetical protein
MRKSATVGGEAEGALGGGARKAPTEMAGMRIRHTGLSHRSEFPPVIPRRVAPQQSPAPLHWLSNYIHSVNLVQSYCDAFLRARGLVNVCLKNRVGGVEGNPNSCSRGASAYLSRRIIMGHQYEEALLSASTALSPSVSRPAGLRG